jgi:hypothetical protein
VTAFAPIQNVRFLDEAFVGTSNGSIATPWTLFSQFYAELGAVTEGWMLTLPGTTVTPDANVPDITTVGSIVFQGLDRRYSQITDLTIDNQSGNPSFVCRDLGIPGTLTIGDGTLVQSYENVDVRLAIPSGTALAGTVRIVDSHFTFAVFSGASGSTFPGGPTLEMWGGDISGQATFATAEFFNVQFGPGALIEPAVGGLTRFVGCDFGAAVTIVNVAGPTIEMDAYSYGKFVAGGGVFAGSIIVPPTLRGVTAAASVSVPANSTAFEDFAAPGMTSAHRAIVNVNNTLPVGIAIAGVWPTPGPNNLRVWFMNNTGAPIVLGGFALSWWATL